MLGHSMGGGVTMASLVAVPDLVDAAVLFAPVSADVRDNFEKWMRNRRETADRIVAAYGEPSEAPEFWDGISPIAHLDRIQAPVMLHHGTADASCKLEWSERLDKAFDAAGKDMTFHVYPGEPHEFIHAWPQVMRRTVEFYDAHLKNGG
jgi:dipeptidyl aminopeptidase/acylaminoacyl peptidase